MATTFEPDVPFSAITFMVDWGTVLGDYTIARIDGMWQLYGGPRPELNNNSPRALTFGELYDVLMGILEALTASETALAAEIATILPEAPV